MSRKDRLLMTARPHLVLDGALLAAAALAAERVIVVVAGGLDGAHQALESARDERSEGERALLDLVLAPDRYVAGESSAIVNLANSGAALPTDTPPRPHQRGVRGVPTLVQNVETLAHVALIARFGVEWFRSSGRNGAAGTVLATVHTGGGVPVVTELESGATVGEAVEAAGGDRTLARGVLLGGYFGSWLSPGTAWDLPLDAGMLRDRGLSLGCGVVATLAADGCGVCETAAVMRYLAAESSAQCGPCFFGLRALADACGQIATGRAQDGELDRLQRWSGEVAGRGACHHPDGAVGFLRSALQLFGSEFDQHAPHGPSRLG